MYIKSIFAKIDINLLHLLLVLSLSLHFIWFVESVSFLILQSVVIGYQIISSFVHLLLRSHDEKIDKLRNIHLLSILFYLVFLFMMYNFTFDSSSQVLNYFFLQVIPQTIFVLYWLLTYKEYQTSKIYLQKHRIFF